MSSISKKVSSELRFVLNTRALKGSPFAVLTKQGHLYFNRGLCRRLGVDKWKEVVVGWDAKNSIIVLKKSEPEEEGCVLFTSKKNSSKIVSVRHLIRLENLHLPKLWKVEFSGNMVYLEPAKTS